MGGPQPSKPRSPGSGPAADKTSAPGSGPVEPPAAEPEAPSGREYVAPRSVPVGLQPQKDDAPKIVLNLPEAAGPAGEREVEVARARRRSATVKVSRGDVAAAAARKLSSREEPTMVTGRHFEAPPELLVDLPSSPPPALVSSGSQGTHTRPPPRERTSRVPLVLFALIAVGGATAWFVTNGGRELPSVASPPAAVTAKNAEPEGPTPPTAVAETAQAAAPVATASALVLTAPPISAGEGETPPTPTDPAAGTGKVGPGVTGVSGTQAPATTQWVAPPRPPTFTPPKTAKPPTGKPPGDIPTSI